MATRLVVIVFCFFTHLGTANAAPTLAEAEKALVKIVCGDAHCSPPITLSNSVPILDMEGSQRNMPN